MRPSVLAMIELIELIDFHAPNPAVTPARAGTKVSALDFKTPTPSLTNSIAGAVASMLLLIVLKVPLTTPFRLSRFCAIFLPVTSSDKLSKESRTPANPTVAAFPKF